MPMKRKKWTEKEEQTLLNAYSSASSASASSKAHMNLKIPTSRQKRLQPIADRVNSLHHLSDPSSYPFLWSWRDVAIKIHNMRHQFLNVKQKIVLSSDCNNSFDWDRALDLWPNFLRYKQVFGGDIDLDPTKDHPPTTNQTDSGDDDALEKEEEEENEDVSDGFKKNKIKKRKKKKREWWRARMRMEEMREAEEMEWMERVVMMQMEHEKQAMQMHADAFQAQLHILSILVRVLCQFFGPPGSGGADGGLPLPTQVVENSQQQQQQRVEEEEERQDEGELGN